MRAALGSSAWAFIGFAVGVGLGMAYGQQAKSRISEAAKTSFSDGKLTVTVDAYEAAASGLPDAWRAYRSR